MCQEMALTSQTNFLHFHILIISMTRHCLSSVVSSNLGWNWEMWWTYDGISGPEFWGVINPNWAMCSQGRRQSPINLDPRTLLHDPNLTPVMFDKSKRLR
ncbi:putative carbonic anhydrase-like protein 1 [Palaemon carinicauda]|uniref:putative carbonic anhydrase-like protein 1 n=1 Tax=Palaemon carinicauda TaxID=392227 RepID=UPI0035B5DBE3